MSEILGYTPDKLPMINDKVDLQFLYAKGFYHSKLGGEWSNKLLQKVLTEKWVDDGTAANPVLDAPWDTGNTVEERAIPKIYMDFYDDLAKSGFLDPYFGLYGKFTHVTMMLHKTPKDYKNYWHGHFVDGTHIHILVHLTDVIRTDEDGGLIEYGWVLNPNDYSLDFQEYYTKEAKSILKTGSFLANNGEIEILLNTHPAYRHQVTDVLTDKNRFTLMIACGYKDNILDDKHWIKYL